VWQIFLANRLFSKNRSKSKKGNNAEDAETLSFLSSLRLCVIVFCLLLDFLPHPNERGCELVASANFSFFSLYLLSIHNE